MELSPTTKIGLHGCREDNHRRGQDRRSQFAETDIPSWHPHHHDQQKVRKSPRNLDEITPKGYGGPPSHPSAESRRRARPPPQHPQPPPPSSPPPYPLLHIHPPPPPPHPPPVKTWHAIFSECQGKHYSDNLNSGETCWERPKPKGARATSRPPTPHDGTPTGKPRPAEIISKNSKTKEISIAASWRYDRCHNTAAANSAEGALQTQAAVLGNSGGDHPHCGFNPCYATGELPCHDKVARPDTNTQQRDCCSGPCRASFTHQASTPHTKRTYDPFAMVGGCGKGGNLSWQTSGDHVKWHGRSKHQTRVNEASLVASSPHDEKQTEATSRRRRPLCQLHLRTGDNSSVSRGSPSRRASCIADCLSLAEHWLAESKKERLQSRTDAPGLSTSLLKAAHSLGDSALGRSTTSLGEQVRPLELETRGTTARLRSKAAAEWAAGEARRRDEEQMTGTPEITRLGRSKRRSVDDLFLFKRTADTARRQNQDDREAQEDIFNTGRPELNTRSKLLAARMSRSRKGDHQSASQRLHRDALEQRQRIENRRTRVEIAARRRANPDLAARSRAVSRSRGDVARRLYEQALSGREHALERERLALAGPQGGTFCPVIIQRSVRLARRRREGWGSGGVEVSGKVGAIEEALLAEGIVYERRRQERQARRERVDEILRQSHAPSRHSKHLLLEIERRGNAKETKSLSGQGGKLSVSEEPTASDDVDQTGLKLNLEALETSKRMLESRYGRGSVPSMEQRAKEREKAREERRAQSVEQEKENDDLAAKATLQQSWGSRISGRRRHSVGVASDVGCNGGIYERTAESNTRKEKRRAVEFQARLEEEMSGCTFTPDLLARRGVRSRQSPGASVTSTSAASGKERRTGQDATSADASISACSRSSGSRDSRRQSNLHQSVVNCDGGGAEEKVEMGGDVGTGAGGIDMPMASGGAATNGLDDDSCSWLLPDNWSAFVTPEGREYFFDSRRGVVQWERPTR